MVVPQATLYAEPDVRAPVVARVEIGTEMEADLRSGTWYHVRRPTGGDAWIQDAKTPTGTTLAVAPYPADRRLAYEDARDVDPPAVARARPQGVPLEPSVPVVDPKRASPPAATDARKTTAVPDRWRIVQSLGLLPYERSDPYNPNALKGDLPVLGKRLGPDWFFNLTGTSDSLIEMRSVPVGPAGAGGSLGTCRPVLFTETAGVGLSLSKGDTVFRPPDYQFRAVPVASVTRTVSNGSNGTGSANPCRASNDQFIGFQELFGEKRLREVSARYDFDSVRVGIQPFTADFRGLLYVDQALGARVFGTRDGNRWQYNLGAFVRLEKDTVSGLNDLSQRPRADGVLVFNLYRQDWPVPGFTTEGVILHNRNREGTRGAYRDDNGVLQRPAALGAGTARDYDVTYFGVNGDGHFQRWNLTAAAYYAAGDNGIGQISQQSERIRAYFGALELSRDFDWIRLRASLLYASGDRNPYDGKATGYDAVLERPLIAGAETSYWMHQSMPLGGGPALSMRNGVLASLRTSREHGQSNFVNPGLRLAGIGADLDVTPRLRLIGNLNYLTFDDMAALTALRNQTFRSKTIGTDISFGLHYRPALTQNVVFNASIAALLPGQGLKDLYGEAADGVLVSSSRVVLLIRITSRCHQGKTLTTGRPLAFALTDEERKPLIATYAWGFLVSTRLRSSPRMTCAPLAQDLPRSELVLWCARRSWRYLAGATAVLSNENATSSSGPPNRVFS